MFRHVKEYVIIWAMIGKGDRINVRKREIVK